MGIRKVVLQGVRWIVGNGRVIDFWDDNWIGQGCLSQFLCSDIPPSLCNVRVCDIWSQGAGWRMDLIQDVLPENIRLQLCSLIVDDVSGAVDRLAWSGSADGKFSVKSAYHLLAKSSHPTVSMSTFFSRIWHVQVPERIRVFLWLVSHQVILTNMERTRRHLGTSSLCTVCRAGDESILHILRDCQAMQGIWTRIVPRRRQRRFFSVSLLEWIYGNLGCLDMLNNVTWATLFAVGIWWAWKWRCGNVFGTDYRCRDRVRFVQEQARDIYLANVQGAVVGTRVRGETRMIKWKRPRELWVKVNTDGASHGNPGRATAGGVIRDADGTWCGGFALNIGVCTAPLAELWGVYYGLYIAWEKGFRRIELEVDSQVIVDLLTKGVNDSHPLSFLARLCHGFLSRDWLVRVSHAYREANRLADGLANYAFSLPIGFHSFDTMPVSVSSVFTEDSNGLSRPRIVRV